MTIGAIISDYASRAGLLAIEGAQKSLDSLSGTTSGLIVVEAVALSYFQDTERRTRGLDSFERGIRILSTAAIFAFLSLAIRAAGNQGKITSEMMKTTCAHTALKIIEAKIYTHAFFGLFSNPTIKDSKGKPVYENVHNKTQAYYYEDHNSYVAGVDDQGTRAIVDIKDGHWRVAKQLKCKDPTLTTMLLGVGYVAIRGADLYLNGGSAMISLLRAQPQPLMKMLPIINRFV